jgi:hypothetical protein
LKGNFNPALLSEELVAAIPDLIETRPEGQFARFTLNHMPGEIFLSIPDELEREVNDVIARHNPQGLSRHQARKAQAPGRKAAIDAKLKQIGFTAEELVFLLEYIHEVSRSAV